jgi:hypothetical protein
MNVRISFNCFSSTEVVQGVHTKHKECIDRICLDSEAQKRQHKNFPLQGVHRDWCKACTVICKNPKPCVKIW